MIARRYKRNGMVIAFLAGQLVLGSSLAANTAVESINSVSWKLLESH